MILLFVGGVSQSELAALERLSKETNREIVVGGTSLLSARDMLEQLERTDPHVEEDAHAGGSGSGGGGGGAAGAGIEHFGPDVDLDAMLNDTF